MSGMIRFLIAALFTISLSFAQEGSQVYISRCLQCHSSTSTTHAPTQQALAQIPWQEILKTLEAGVMKVQAQNLSQDDRIAVSLYIGKEADTQVLPQIRGFCAAVRSRSLPTHRGTAGALTI